MLACPPRDGGSDRLRDLVAKHRETGNGPRPPYWAPSPRHPHSSFRLKGLRCIQPGASTGCVSRWGRPAGDARRVAHRPAPPDAARRGTSRRLRVAELCRPMRASAGWASGPARTQAASAFHATRRARREVASYNHGRIDCVPGMLAQLARHARRTRRNAGFSASADPLRLQGVGNSPQRLNCAYVWLSPALSL